MGSACADMHVRMYSTEPVHFVNSIIFGISKRIIRSSYRLARRQAYIIHCISSVNNNILTEFFHSICTVYNLRSIYNWGCFLIFCSSLNLRNESFHPVWVMFSSGMSCFCEQNWSFIFCHRFHFYIVMTGLIICKSLLDLFLCL